MCTRIVYLGPNKTVITARSMDWKTEIPANLWVFPKGIERSSQLADSSMKWKSKYGSVVTSSWDLASSDGMNEAGLAGNLLWLAESKYPESCGEKPDLEISLWLQYVLDNFATVEETVTELRKENFTVVSFPIPGTDKFTTVHMSLSDSTGDSAIFEYIDGKLVIHHDRSYVTMTNSPIYEEQLAINTYWKSISGQMMLPGTNRAADRFVRASYYLDAVPKTDDMRVAIPTVLSVIRNVSVPFGISSPTEPNISSTRWRSLSDHKNLVYHFENILTPNVVSLCFQNLDFSEGARVKKLTLENNENYSGDVAHQLKNAEPFTFATI